MAASRGGFTSRSSSVVMTPFFPFTWKEFIDLLLISFLLHRLYLLFRGTTALQVAIGVFFLWLVYFAAERAGLVLTTRFFQAMATVAAVGLIVIFRREIREVLLQTNSLRFFLGQSGAPLHVVPDEAASTVFHLAARRIGCLICFQKHENIEEFVEEGTVLDCRFSQPVIESLFSKESPLHDGAVIVRDGRIARAGAFLPLTNEKDLPEKLGTRHRAALGLSESCDAVTLVVSEERGEVSLVHRGKLETFENVHALRRRLQSMLGTHEPRKSPRGTSFEGLRQVGGLALVFLMVTVLWNLYLGGGESMITMQVPAELRNVPEQTEVTHDFEEHFVVRISGKNPLVEALRPNQVSAFIDLEGLSLGDHELAIGPENVRLPPGLQIEGVAPETVEVQMEPRIEREIPVEVVFAGNAPGRMSVATFTPDPATVSIVGSRSRVEDIDYLPTIPVKLDALSLDEDREITGKLAPLPQGVSLGEGHSREVRITVEMQE